MANETKSTAVEAVGGFFKAVGGFFSGFGTAVVKGDIFCKIITIVVGCRLCKT